jgi:hypothetical protein
MRCAPVLFSYAAFAGIFRVQVFGGAGIDRFCHLMFRQQTWQKSEKLRPSSLGCECGNRLSDFQAWRFCQASLCAVHVRKFEGASPLSNLVEVKD